MHQAAVIAISVAMAAGVAALLVPRRLRPDRAVRLITALVLLSAGGSLWAMCLIVSANLAQLHGVAERLALCTNIAGNHRGSFTPIGIVSLAAATSATVSAVRMRVRQRGERVAHDGRELAIVLSDEPVAYALPGRPGQVVISTAMLRCLEPPERRVLIAHERSHLRRHHHRYIRLAELAVSALPVLTPLNGRLRFAIERWADEDAAMEIGDRATVASAIARAALASASCPEVGLAIADVGVGVVERVEVLLAGPARISPLIELPLGAVLTASFGLVLSLVLVAPQVLAVLGLCR